MAEIMNKEVVDRIVSIVKNEFEKMPKLNIMVLGKTGVGKSTLINSIFGDTLVRTGVGRPVTSDIVRVEKKDFPLALYDTPGLELRGDNDFTQLSTQVTDIIRDCFTDDIEGNEIHLLLYCVNTASHRFEPSEAAFLRLILENTRGYNVPVILAMTQSFSKKDTRELKSVIESEKLPLSGIVPVLAADYFIDAGICKPAYGVEELVELISDMLPETIQNTFIALERANLELKVKKARAIVTASAAGAAATGAVPLPVADAAVLVPEQIAMLAGITAAFGFPVDKSVLMTIVTGTIGSAGAVALGRTVVSTLLNIIPGAGTAAGAVISGGTAAAITYALGEAYVKILSKVYRGDMGFEELSTDAGREQISNIFRNQLRLKRLPNGKPVEEIKEVGSDD
ncbi:Uncharacterized conserved protein, DUF697 family [Ruminococcaceae bacterium YRB3002]|nr:Uncharacterized conserved protein, DUF697 family [Ruminococcaceae bacterium YRB3002]